MRLFVCVRICTYMYVSVRMLCVSVRTCTYEYTQACIPTHKYSYKSVLGPSLCVGILHTSVLTKLIQISAWTVRMDTYENDFLVCHGVTGMEHLVVVVYAWIAPLKIP
jgi:hypothetical protein